MVYLNVKYVIATRSYNFFIYTQNLIGNFTLSRVIISVARGVGKGVGDWGDKPPIGCKEKTFFGDILKKLDTV